MSSDILAISLSGLNAAQRNLITTSHNVANVNTPGFSRQQTVQSSGAAVFTGAGFFGTGAQVADVRRIYNDFVGSQLVGAQTAATSANRYNELMSSLLNRIGNPETGINAALDGFFAAVQDFAMRPSEVGPRQALLSSAEVLTARFRGFDEQFSVMRRNVNEEITATIGLMNQSVKAIAQLNERIVQSIGAGQGRAPNDLLDQRGQLLRELSQQIGITVAEQSDGAVNVFLQNGQPLVIGRSTFEFQARPDASSQSGLVIELTTRGAPVPVSETQLRGGTIAALVQFRDGELARAQDTLGELAASIARDYNIQHQFGLDLNGAFGGPLFSIGEPLVFARAGNQGAPVLRASLAQPATAVTPPATPTAADLRGITPEPFQLRVTGANTVTLVDSAGNLQGGPIDLSGGAAALVNGVWLSLSNTTGLAVGDDFTVSIGRQAASAMRVEVTDPRRLAGASRAFFEVASSRVPPPAAGEQLPAFGQNLQVTLDAPVPFEDGEYRAFTAPIEITFTAPNEFRVQLGDPSIQINGIPYSASARRIDSEMIQQALQSAVPPVSAVDVQRVTFPGRWAFDVAGTPEIGTSFTLNPVLPATLSSPLATPSDNRNAVALGRLANERRTGPLDGGGFAFTYTDRYSALISDLGSRGAEVRAVQAARENALQQLEAEIQSFSGVNLDEEAANLIRFQQAYGASSKVLSTASQLFQEFLASIR